MLSQFCYFCTNWKRCWNKSIDFVFLLASFMTCIQKTDCMFTHLDNVKLIWKRFIQKFTRVRAQQTIRYSAKISNSVHERKWTIYRYHCISSSKSWRSMMELIESLSIVNTTLFIINITVLLKRVVKVVKMSNPSYTDPQQAKCVHWTTQWLSETFIQKYLYEILIPPPWSSAIIVWYQSYRDHDSRFCSG